MCKLPSPSTEGLIRLINMACAGPDRDLPGVVAMVVDKNGDQVFAHAAGQRGHGHDHLGVMQIDTLFWIASCTKLITGIACMQLVERGVLTLDDTEIVQRHCPELRHVRVLQPDGRLVEKQRDITLRMLLSHTAGFGYSFIDANLRDHNRPPGEAWEYGIGVDWAGFLLERVTGQTLHEYMQQHIFQPLRLIHISMVPNEANQAKMACMHQQDSNGQLYVRKEHPFQRSLAIGQNPNDSPSSFCFSGGAGCFSTAHDYCRILSTLLNSGTCPLTGTQLLSRETVDEMFRNQIPHLAPLNRKHMPAAKPELTTAATGGGGLTFLLSGGDTGRSIGTAQWTGLPNLRWWCDRENGLAGIFCAQILPFGDLKAFALAEEIERQVYAGLSEARRGRPC
ncbi:beta-lactamase/transpeptidase-like protein [Aspergillus welwitschiae]|uniref:Beta-lactamase/transpeptidase-like protein n=1 Tax=Aspergillus welwitschiae TaxID=1341132 RepID=A0A3F3PJT2_9EURO|nr:beta-lactamase/transpeptidase-like protein [Aspergillus welwitschiae]RDH27200.1 beta-lactamase/transpeptidase-like protein [Aspergillus welwitschiae]